MASKKIKRSVTFSVVEPSQSPVQVVKRLFVRKQRSITLLDAEQSEMVKHLAELLKKTGRLRLPENMDLIKTGRYKTLAPFNPEWFYIRCAAILRHIYIRSPIGVKTITKMFGGRNRKGAVPSHFCRSAKGVARRALQALEDLNFIEKTPENKGRRLTIQGRRDIDRAAAHVVHNARLAAKMNVITLDN